MDLTILCPAVAVLCLLYAGYLAKKVMSSPEGTDEMKSISAAIREGAKSYLGRQYKTVAIFFAGLFTLLLVLSLLKFIDITIPFAFLTGGIFSALAGYLGMQIATNSNNRTAWAAKESTTAVLATVIRVNFIRHFLSELRVC